MHAVATGHRSSERRSWAAEIISLIDEGRFAQAARLLGVLADCGPDAATARCSGTPVSRSSSSSTRLRARSIAATARAAVRALFAGAAAPRARDRLGAGADPGDALAKWPLAIRVFGPVGVWVHGRTQVPRVDVAAPSRAVLRVLGVNRGRPVAPDWLMDQLWPDAAAGAAGNSLNVAVHALRRALCAAPARGRRGWTTWRAATVRTGSRPGSPRGWTSSSSSRPPRAGPRGPQRRRRAPGRGALPDGHGPPTGAPVRGRRRRLARGAAARAAGNCCDVLEGLAELLLGLGDVERAEQACRRLLAIDPLVGLPSTVRALCGRPRAPRGTAQTPRARRGAARDLVRHYPPVVAQRGHPDAVGPSTRSSAAAVSLCRSTVIARWTRR